MRSSGAADGLGEDDVLDFLSDEIDLRPGVSLAGDATGRGDADEGLERGLAGDLPVLGGDSSSVLLEREKDERVGDLLTFLDNEVEPISSLSTRCLSAGGDSTSAGALERLPLGDDNASTGALEYLLRGGENTSAGALEYLLRGGDGTSAGALDCSLLSDASS